MSDANPDSPGDESPGGATGTDTTAGEGADEGTGTGNEASGHGRNRADLLAEVELLREENRRLRESYVRAKRSRNRRVAAGFVVLGLAATAGAAVFPTARTVLLALSATGLFSGLLTYYLTPEQFVAAGVGAGVYATLAANLAAIATELGLTDQHVYVPVGAARARVKLFVPHHESYTLPDDEALQSVFVLTGDPDERGVAFDPAGDGLFEEFERALDGPLAGTVPDLTGQIRDGIVEQFEIAGEVAFDSDAGGRVTAEIRGDVYGDVSRFDHPVRSFVAVGLARGLDSPVRIAHADDTTVTFRIGAQDETGSGE